jgi:predicted O-linked N-acetylglucosamine transferase (SPINDLY family)
MSGQPSATDPLAPWRAVATTRAMGLVELLAAIERLTADGQAAAGVELYKIWIAHHLDDPLLHAVHFNHGVALSQLGDIPGAMIAHAAAIRLKPDFFQPYINLGGLQDRVGQGDRAVATWTTLVNSLSSVTGDAVIYKAMALKQIGRVLEGARESASAEEALRQSIDLQPDQPEAIQHWVALRQTQCRWPVVEPWGHVRRQDLMASISPLSAAYHADDPMFHLATASGYARRMIGYPVPGPAPSPAARRPGRMRIGYVSSDLREHAVGFAMTDVFETHDRARVETFAYDCGIAVSDPTRARIKAAAEHWIDINGMDDAAVAARIAADGIDILVDLNGYTKDARTRVFALRPAPVAVNWFGFPGSMGTPYHHYILADARTIPPEYEMFYSERVVRLPCYQPNDRKRVVSPRRPVRAEAGLPEGAFVFAALNGLQKITQPVFDSWLRMLAGVPGSVLWLFQGNGDTPDRIRAHAARSGIAPDRLVFASPMPNPDHLARFALADLFVDTFPYGAHTTASDALWMGLPVLTMIGRSFASRVCAGLVEAAGIGEMVCAGLDQYVERAIAFGRDPALLAPIAARLRNGRDASLLFDTPRLVRALEDAYAGMMEDWAGGRLPKPDLDNIAVYQELCATMDVEAVGALDDAGYAAAYRARVAERDSAWPIPPDRRFARAAPGG